MQRKIWAGHRKRMSEETEKCTYHVIVYQKKLAMATEIGQNGGTGRSYANPFELQVFSTTSATLLVPLPTLEPALFQD